MRTNDAGIDLIKNFEGLRLAAYQDSVGVWTIGYGHTAAAGAPIPTAGLRITEDEAEAILRRDLGQYEAAVADAVRVPLTENQFAALVSFTFNLGGGALRRSTLGAKLNAGDYAGAAAEFPKWNRAGGKVLAGLTRRREAERDLFLTVTDPIRRLQSLIDTPADGIWGKNSAAALTAFRADAAEVEQLARELGHG